MNGRADAPIRLFWNSAGAATWIILPACIGLFVALCLVQWSFHGNVPTYDDYAAILNFLAAWHDADSATAKLQLLLAPFNEHRIVTTRILALADHALFGQVSLQRLALYAALALVPIAVAVRRIIRAEWPSPHSGLLSLGTALLIFRLEQWKHLLYAMANIQAIWAVAFALWFFIALVESWSGAAVFGLLLLAILTNSSSLLLVPLGLVALVASAHTDGRRRRFALVFAVVGIGVMALYLYGIKGADLLGNLVTHPLDCLCFALVVLGSGLAVFSPAPVTVLIFGAGLLVATLAIVVATPASERRATKLCLVFLCAVCALIGAGRGVQYLGLWPVMAFDGRYRIYSLVAVALLIPIAASLFAQHRKLATTLALLVALEICAASYLRNLPEWRVAKTGRSDKLAAETKGLVPDSADGIALHRAMALGIYTPPGVD